MLYPKIESPFKRDMSDGPNRNKLIHGDWVRDEFRYLSQLDWTWTEKVDGTNIRVMWDGYTVTFGGRTDKAVIPAHLLERLEHLFPENVMEVAFGGRPVTLFGEGFGPKIQKGGGKYSSSVDFILFDVHISGWWLHLKDVHSIAGQLGISAVPVIHNGPVGAAINIVRNGHSSTWSGEYEFLSEGLVGRPPCGILARNGDRMLMKIKSVDFYQGDHSAIV